VLYLEARQKKKYINLVEEPKFEGLDEAKSDLRRSEHKCLTASGQSIVPSTASDNRRCHLVRAHEHAYSLQFIPLVLSLHPEFSHYGC